MDDADLSGCPGRVVGIPGLEYLLTLYKSMYVKMWK